MNLPEATEALQDTTGIRADPREAAAVSGGSINDAYRVPSDHGVLFVKLNDAAARSTFEAEADGLEALRESDGVAVPAVLGFGCSGSTSYLALEWIEFAARSNSAERALAVGLARQHRVSAELFGWRRDNVIGATLQPNETEASWISFLRERRLGFQLDLAAGNGLPASLQEAGVALLADLDRFFDSELPEPSLLHGDLWSGNWGATEAQVPYVFDPAAYFGDREADIAMTRLFGGFGSAFYDSYRAEWPLRAGWEARTDLYNLYHVLNHFNLFGSSYLHQVSGVLKRLTAYR